ncbi:MAG: glycosyltransferase family 4 protein [Acidilobaceae archaeon]
MRVAVLHHRWGYGGAQVVFFYAVRALAEAGFDVTVLTVEKPEFRVYEDIVGEPFPPGVRVERVLPVGVRAFTIYKGLLSGALAPLLAPRGSYDVLLATHGYPVMTRGLETPLVFYVQAPASLVFDDRYNPELSTAYSLKSPLREGVVGSLWSAVLWLYSRPYVLLGEMLARSVLRGARRILVNSAFTLEALRYAVEKYGCCDDALSRAEILHPPLPRAGELVAARRPEREPCVTAMGRLSPEKRIDLVVETARVLEDMRFYVLGAVWGRASRAYYEKVRSAAPRNVTIEVNAPSERKRELLSKCSVYLHPAAGEAFGIAPLEAMAAGATLVVHKSSGTWTDVCLEGSYCYGFESQDPRDIARRVEEALARPKVAPLEHIERFSPKRFASGIVRAVESALES